jgi:hypothetical protein
LPSLLLISSPVWAQAPESEYTYPAADGYFGIHVGFVELQDVDDDGSFNVGIGGGFFLFSGFAVGGAFDFQQSDFTLETDDVTIFFPGIERETFSLQLELNFTPLPDSVVRPYVLGGVGYYWSKYSDESFGQGHVSDEGYFAGVGLETFGGAWRQGVALAVETRWLFTQEATYGEEKFAPDGFNVSLGLRFKF